MPRVHAKHKRQQGQALTEFLVAAVAIIPLFLLIPLIAKYQDISHSTQAASRYAAFDAMTRNDSVSTWKAPSQLADEVRRRFFSNPDAPIKTNDVAGDFQAHQNLFWRGPQNEPLIKEISNDVQVSFGQASSSDQSGGFSGASDGTPFVLRNQLDLQARGIYTANVSVALVNMPDGLKFYEPFNNINLRVQRSTSLAIDPWTARSPAQVEQRIEKDISIFPSKVLRPFSPVVDAAVTVIELPGNIDGPQLGRLDFWRDVVPQDRLRPRN